MTEQTIPADDVREIIGKMRYHANHDNVRGTEEEYFRFFASQLEALLPTPPTLADMTHTARRECQWMQCEVRGDRRIIARILDDGDESHAVTLDPYGYTSNCSLEMVTPLPDLPSLEWPGTYPKPEDATLAKVGDVIESADDPRLAALPDGTILVDRDDDAVIKWGGEWSGAGCIPSESQGSKFGPWKVVYIGQETD